MDKKEWSEQDLKEFEELCAPLVEFIQKRHDKCNPYSWIIIQWNGVAFMPDSFWFPFKYRISTRLAFKIWFDLKRGEKMEQPIMGRIEQLTHVTPTATPATRIL